MTSAFDLVLLVACGLLLCGRTEPSTAVEGPRSMPEWRPIANVALDLSQPDAQLDVPEDFLLIRADQSTAYRHIHKLIDYVRAQGVERWQRDAHPAPTTKD